MNRTETATDLLQQQVKGDAEALRAERRPAPTALTNTTIKVKSGDRQHGWLDLRASFAGADYPMQAQIFAEPSEYGILAGRISRLTIRKLGDFQPVAGDPDTMKRGKFEIYNYDRGLDFDHTPTGLIAATLTYFEGR